MNKFFWIFLILSMIFSLSLKAEEKIAFIDLDMIINQSEYGKKSFKKIDNEYEKEKKKLLSIEKELLSKEQNLSFP